MAGEKFYMLDSLLDSGWFSLRRSRGVEMGSWKLGGCKNRILTIVLMG
jgi:hypothetical protein